MNRTGIYRSKPDEERLRIMLIEDEPFICSIFRYQLLLAGYKVEVVHDPRQAPNVFDSFKPVLVMMELILPHVDGFGLLGYLAKKNSAKIVVLSRLDNTEDINKALELGASAFLVKFKTTPRVAVEAVNEICQKIKLPRSGKRAPKLPIT